MTKPSSFEHQLAAQEKYYAEEADRYDAACFGNRDNRSHTAKLFRIHQLLHLTAGNRVLEIGTGTGIHGAKLLQWNPEVAYSGVDLSPDMLEQARTRIGSDADLHACPAEQLPFPDEHFDGAFCCATIHHLADKEKGIQEMIRVLKPGCPIVLCEPNLLNPLNIRQWMFIPEEKGQLDIRMKNIRRWFHRHGVTLTHHEFLNFTHPGPPRLANLLNRIDAACKNLPVIRRISSVVIFAGVRDAPSS